MVAVLAASIRSAQTDVEDKQRENQTPKPGTVIRSVVYSLKFGKIQKEKENILAINNIQLEVCYFSL